MFLDIFSQILNICISFGLVSGKEILIDSNNVKANASIDSMVDVNISPEIYWRELDNSKEKEDKNTKYIASQYSGEISDEAKIGNRGIE